MRGSNGIVTLRKLSSDHDAALGFTVPAPIARALIDAGMLGASFKAEVSEDGILYRPVDSSDDLVTLPVWATKEAH